MVGASQKVAQKNACVVFQKAAEKSGKSSKFALKKTGAMKTFRTELPSGRAPFALTHADRLLLVGSCFTEHIGGRLSDARFNTLLNPNGIVYNPISIAGALNALMWGDFAPPEAETDGLFEYNGLWHSWEHHGRFSAPDRAAALGGIREAREKAAVFLQKTNRLLLTLGTAEVFALRESGRVVANNHKAPPAWFDQRRLRVDETSDALKAVLLRLKQLLPELRVVLTVSPVRHLRNGFVENQRSKSVLVLACAALCEQLDFVCYFPAYELLLDDLRDYRFYASDMIHPSETAVGYIWEYFAAAFFPLATRQMIDAIGKITAAARHRPSNPDTAEHRRFAQKQLEAILALEAGHPQLDFSAEKTYFQQYCL